MLHSPTFLKHNVSHLEDSYLEKTFFFQVAEASFHLLPERRFLVLSAGLGFVSPTKIPAALAWVWRTNSPFARKIISAILSLMDGIFGGFTIQTGEEYLLSKRPIDLWCVCNDRATWKDRKAFVFQVGEEVKSAVSTLTVRSGSYFSPRSHPCSTLRLTFAFVI